MTNESERAAFEKWAKNRRLFPLDREPTEPAIYRDCMTSNAWVGWQARAQLIAEQEKVEAVYQTRTICKCAPNDSFCICSDRWRDCSADWYANYKDDGEAEYRILYPHPAPSTDRVAAQGGDELVEDAVAKAIADAMGHGMREKCEPLAHAAIAAYLRFTAAEALRATPADGDKLAKAIGDGV